MSPEVLQLCGSDLAPFQALCDAHAKALGELGAKVTTVFMEPSCLPHKTMAGRVEYLDLPPGFHRRDALRSLRSKYARTDWQFVLCHRYKMMRIGAALLPRGEHHKILALAHEFGYFRRWQRVWHQRLLLPNVQFAAVSSAVADDMQQANPAIGKVLVLPNAIDMTELRAAQLERQTARTALHLPQDGYYLGYIGRLHYKKEPGLALEAFANVVDQLPARASLVMVGDGDLAVALKTRAYELGISNRVYWLGQVPDAARYIHAFDQLLFTTGPKEAFGVALLEAMSANVPVVCADSPGPRSVLGDAGIYYRTGDLASLVAALRQSAAMAPEAAAIMQCRARERAEACFGVPALAANYARLLAQRHQLCS